MEHDPLSESESRSKCFVSVRGAAVQERTTRLSLPLLDPFFGCGATRERSESQRIEFQATSPGWKRAGQKLDVKKAAQSVQIEMVRRSD